MVKVSCGFVSNSSSVTYFMMWVGVDDPPPVDARTQWVGVSTLAEELRGFPGVDALDYPGESKCLRHFNNKYHPTVDGENYLCSACMSNWDEWIAVIKRWVQSKRTKGPYASALVGSASGLPHVVSGGACETTPELSRDILVRIFKFNITGEWSETPQLDCEVLKTTKNLISASAVCKLWREVALDEELWSDVVKESVVQRFLPGWWEDTEQQARFSHLEHITSCRELALRISKMEMAWKLRVEAGELIPRFREVIQGHFDKPTHENLAAVLREQTSGTIIVGHGYEREPEPEQPWMAIRE
ncbi:hypothetical protein Pelo_3402 [Pelomyxa schiedti]|nr:hypothetical protein Pelo_3402 [Pelomyxa schiedti]